jgi:hypothetical protein
VEFDLLEKILGSTESTDHEDVLALSVRLLSKEYECRVELTCKGLF